MKWPKEHLTLTEFLIEKAREISTLLNIEKSSNHDTVNNSFLRHTSWYLKPTDKNLETVEMTMTRVMLTFLEPKSNYLTDGALFKKTFEGSEAAYAS